MNQLKKYFSFSAMLLYCFCLHAQTDSVHQINKKRLSGLIIGSSVAYVGTMIGLSTIWYSNYDKQSFHFFNDASEWKQVDKVGHFYSAFQFSNLASKGLQWSNVPQEKSDKIGALTGFAILSSIEVLDGFSAGYGASVSDLVANAAGSAFYLGQNLIWSDVRIYPKFSFHTTEYPDQSSNDLLGSSPAEQIIKDYNGQTYWLSVDIDKFIKFPKWINLAVGYGAEDMIYANDSQNREAGYDPYRQFYLSIDFDLTSIRTTSKLAKSLIFIANMIKLPGPTLEFSKKGIKAYPLYF
ncbi:MAG: DUF2279 domain-containing protein [Bacteroidota bacterium]